VPSYNRDTRAAHRRAVERVLRVSLENLPFTLQKQCGGKATRCKLSALRRRPPTQRRFDDFTLEQVVPICLQALEYLPEVTLGRERDAPMRCQYAVRRDEALNRGWEKRDSRSPALLQLERCGLKVERG
jgi:hypothetical protein